MSKYGGYPWSRESYVTLAGSFPWEWWASRDYCCEAEIAKDRTEVEWRIKTTAEEYFECIDEAKRQGVPPPLPVLQGRAPQDYEWCASLMGDLPALVGVGSMCRRVVKELVAVVEHLDRALPPAVKLHLFGVKSAGVRALAGHSRVASTDSMAWDYRAAKVAIRRRHLDPTFSCTLEFRAGFLRDWYRKQQRIVLEALL
jgi:hypothetical protein